jgi:uncharacterized repeat protein (TIGR01451 family)
VYLSVCLLASGDKIRYTVTARNTGNTQLSSVVLANAQDTTTCNLGTVAPDGGTPLASSVCPAAGSALEYTVTQADLDSGSVTIVGAGTAVRPPWTAASDRTMSTSGQQIVAAFQSPAMQVDLTADFATVSTPGVLVWCLVYGVACGRHKYHAACTFEHMPELEQDTQWCCVISDHHTHLQRPPFQGVALPGYKPNDGDALAVISTYATSGKIVFQTSSRHVSAVTAHL